MAKNVFYDTPLYIGVSDPLVVRVREHAAMVLLIAVAVAGLPVTSSRKPFGASSMNAGGVRYLRLCFLYKKCLLHYQFLYEFEKRI